MLTPPVRSGGGVIRDIRKHQTNACARCLRWVRSQRRGPALPAVGLGKMVLQKPPYPNGKGVSQNGRTTPYIKIAYPKPLKLFTLLYSSTSLSDRMGGLQSLATVRPPNSIQTHGLS